MDSMIQKTYSFAGMHSNPSANRSNGNYVALHSRIPFLVSTAVLYFLIWNFSNFIKACFATPPHMLLLAYFLPCIVVALPT